MRVFIIVLATGLLLSSPAMAAPSKKSQILYKYLSQSFFQVGTGFTFWQEKIEATTPTGTEMASTRFQGFHLETSYFKPFGRGRRFLYSLTAFGGFGQSEVFIGGSINENFSNRGFAVFGVAPGLFYRTGLRTEIGLRLPLNYRVATWALPTSSNITMESGSFSYGLTGVLVTRLNLKSALVISLTHQQVWAASQWGIAWQYDFR